MEDQKFIAYLMIGAYALLTLIISLYGFRREENTPGDYFLAGRKVGALVLFFTIVATNFSAFFFLGFAGAGYRIGYSYYGMMAFGTAFVAVAFHLMGHRACLVSFLAGEALLVGFATGAIPAAFALGFLPDIPIVLVTSAVVVLGSLAGRRPAGQQAW